MANDYSSDASVDILDTAATVAAAGVGVFIAGFRWVGVTTAAHTCIVKDSNGKVIWSAKALAANSEIQTFFGFKPLHAAGGYVLDTIASGILYVYRA